MDINYTAEPTAKKFHASPKLVRGFMGCVGNGKSVACNMEMLRVAHEQWPNAQGFRKTRWAIIRNTNSQLSTTTLNTWKAWIPEQIAPVIMSPMIKTRLIQPIKSDNTVLDMEVYFVPLDRDKDVRKLLSMELTGIFINETREVGYRIFDACGERIGRYPSKVEGYEDVWEGGKLVYDAPKLRNEDGSPKMTKDGKIAYKPCRRKSIIMDTNPPDDDHWWYQLAEEGCLRSSTHKDAARKEVEKKYDFFRGPPPLIEREDGTYDPNPAAENISNLNGGYDYYLDMIGGKKEDYIKVQVLGQYGSLMDGKPVFPNYNDNLHCPEKHFLPIKGLPICLGWDFGGTPAVIIAQQTEAGQVRLIAELWSDEMHVRQFARDVVKPYLQKHFPDFEIGFSVGDPSGNNRGEGDGKSSIRILNDDYVENNEDGDIIVPLNMGFETVGAPTNDPVLRQDAVDSFLTRLVDKGQPGMLIDKRCKRARKGFLGGYHFKKIAVGGVEDKFREVPDKNMCSHIHDGIQYVSLGFQGGYVTVPMSKYDYYEQVNEQNSEVGYW